MNPLDPILEILIAAIVTTFGAGAIAPANYRAGAAVVVAGTVAGLIASIQLIAMTFLPPYISTVVGIGGLTFTINKLTALFTLTTFIIGFAAALYAVDIVPKRTPAALPPFLSLFIFSIALLGLSADPIAACIFVELQAMSIIFILLAGEEYASEAGVKYLYMTLLGTIIELSGLGLLMIYGAQFVLGLALFTVGLFLKVGLFPFHAWLPDVHARAHTSASAVLSSVAVASGMVAVMNIVEPMIGSVAALTAFGYCLLALSIASAAYGSLCAVTQPDVKRALAFSTIGHMGFAGIPFSLAMIIPSAKWPLLSISMLYLIVHALGKSLLFLAGGLPVALYGVHEYTHLGGLFRRHKVATWTFLGGALTLSGLPPLPGFFAKLFVLYSLAYATVALHSWLMGGLLAFILGVAIVTPAYAIRRLWHRTFLGPEKTYPETPTTYLANAACIILMLALLILGTLPAFALAGQILVPPLR